MSKIMKAQIIQELRSENKNINEMAASTIETYVMIRYKCSKYLAKQIVKELHK
jgi:hypothetical protein